MGEALRRAAWLVLPFLLAACGAGPVGSNTVVNDVTQINPINVERVVAPRTIDEVRRLVRMYPGPISIAGGRYSMGGQIATEQALVIDMRKLDRVLDLQPDQRTIKVEAGITWRKIQEAIDPHDLSLAIMQSYANFTVGGSLSVNAHGRYVNRGPLIHAVRAIEIVLADGSLVEATPAQNSEIFYGAIGGYGALGVIATATLELAPNDKLERRVQHVRVEDYPKFFDSEIRGSTTAILHNADIYPPRYDSTVAITYRKTDRDVTVKDRLHPGGRYLARRALYGLITRMPGGERIRAQVIDPIRLSGAPVVWRNYEASYDVGELEPFSRKRSTYVLQEYFVPVARFAEFVPKMAEIFQRYDADVVNVSIRHAYADPGSLMAWAKEECFAFVVYYRQGVQRHQRTAVGVWTRELIDAALSVGGTYYLPYQPQATDAQFHAAYPRADELFALKAKVDPTYKFRNTLWNRYYPPPIEARAEQELQLAAALAKREGYRRGEEQTYLTLPEWYIVYSADEYAAFVRERYPSEFPWFGSIGQFWSIYSKISDATRGRYPYNWTYRTMIWVIGASFTAENGFKGLYENTAGRLTEWISLDDNERTATDRYMNEVAGEYAAFMHHTPWYEFPFPEKLSALWSGAADDETGSVRNAERKLAFSGELVAKTLWAKMLKQGTGAPEDLEVQALARCGTADPAAAYEGIRVLERFDGDACLLGIPRYEQFTRAVPALLATDARLLEIAGNRRIMLTVIAPADWDGAPFWGDMVYEWPILTDRHRKRVAFTVGVERLHDVLAGLAEDRVALDHIYDY